MKRADASPANATSDTGEATSGYRKGDETRQRILLVALNVFGELGYKSATTRQIAERAGVNLPALKYYFGGKEGLYIACAREIVGRYEARMLKIVTDAHADLRAGMPATEARTRLKRVIGGLAKMLISDEETATWATFVSREMSDKGPAFNILYDHLWQPGVELASGLIARATNERVTTPAARVHALLLIASLSAFSTTRSFSLQFLEWPNAKDERFKAVMRVVEDHIDRLG